MTHGCTSSSPYSGNKTMRLGNQTHTFNWYKDDAHKWRKHKIGPILWNIGRQNILIFTNMCSRLFKLLRIKKQS